MVGEPVDIVVEELEWTNWSVGHLAEHGVTPAKVDEIRTNAPRFFRNLPDRSGSNVMIGPDLQGSFYYIVLRPALTRGLWRPVTGWRMNRRRAMRLYRERKVSR